MAARVFRWLIRGGPISVGVDDVVVVDAYHSDGTCTAHVEQEKVMKFEAYEDAQGEWRWRLVAKNGRTVCDSGEGYHGIGNVRRAIKTTRKLMMNAPIVVIRTEEQRKAHKLAKAEAHEAAVLHAQEDAP